MLYALYAYTDQYCMPAVFTVCIHRPAVFTGSTAVFTVWHTQALLYVMDVIRCIPAVFAVYPLIPPLWIQRTDGPSL